jgi:hypothetical protein
MQAPELEEVEVVLWGAAESSVEAPTGAAAAFAIVAFMAFVMGLCVAALVLL